MSLIVRICRLPSSGFRRILSTLWVLTLRILGVRVGAGARILGRPVVARHSGSALTVGPRAMLISRPRDTALGVGHPIVLRTLSSDARLTIGSDCGMSGVTICAAHRVEIGDRVLLGADVLIVDTDFHPVDVLPRRYEPPPTVTPGNAVVVEDDAFIGARSIVLAGSHIGVGSVIGAGSVVSGEIPAHVVAVGNPCHVVRRLKYPA